MNETPLHAEFAKWLAAKMTAFGFNRSDLARLIWGTTVDARGYTVARNRDRIGHYLAGTSYPGFNTQYKLAKAFSIFPDDIPGPGKTRHAARAVLSGQTTPDTDAFTQVNQKLDRIIDLLAARQIE